MQKNKKQILVALACEAESLAAIGAIASPYYEVVKMRDPKRALMCLGEHEPVTAVVADHRLSGGTSGVTLLAAVQKRWPAVQRILLAEPEDMPQVIRGLHCGAVQHVLNKPLQEEELLQVIRPPAARAATRPAAAQPRSARRAAG